MNTRGVEIYYTRHAESAENAGQPCIDPPLSTLGREQAAKLEGHYDCVVMSSLRRTQETLHYSKITYGERIINPDFRERIFGQSTCLMFEYEIGETDESFFSRVNKFNDWLNELIGRVKENGKILLIGHAYYFNGWYRKGCWPGPNHAQVMRIFDKQE